MFRYRVVAAMAAVPVTLALVAVIAITTASTSVSAAAPVYLYWANSMLGDGRPAATTIGRARLDGTGVEQSFTGVDDQFITGLAIPHSPVFQTADPCGIAVAGKYIRLPGSHLLDAGDGQPRTPENDDRTCQPRRLRRQQPVHHRHPRHMRRPRRQSAGQSCSAQSAPSASSEAVGLRLPAGPTGRAVDSQG
jgi:hypothetical protein